MSIPPHNSKRYYLAVWKDMLGTLLGWSEERIIAWAQQGPLWAALDNPNDITFHETPMYWAKHLLIPAPLRARLPHEQLLRLERDLWGVFTGESKHPHADPQGIDWEPYEEKVADLLTQYAATAPGEGEPSR
jgi:hypothetical protein